jgi:hypothetical protein
MIPTRLTAVASTELDESIQADLTIPDPASAVAAEIIFESTIDAVSAGCD